MSSATTFGKVPPNDLDAERAVLSACLLSSEALDEVAADLRAEHFYSPAHQVIWSAMADLYRAAQPVDVVMVAQGLRASGQLERAGGAAYLAQVTDSTPATSHVGQHAELVVGLSRLRRAIELCHDRAAAGYGATGDVEGHLAALERDVMALAQKDAKCDGVTLRESLRMVAEAMARAAEGKIVGIETGFRDLDQKTGGSAAGDLVVIAARPGMGKTALVSCVARNVAKRGTVAWFSLEMPHEQLTARMLASESGADLRHIRSGKITESEGQAIMAAASILDPLPIVFDDSSGISASDIRSRARRIACKAERAGKPLVAAVVDYIQLVKGEVDGNREVQVAHISRSLKWMARELKVPVFALSQLNRAVETRGGKDKRPVMADLRESGAIEQDADAIWFIYRAGYYAEQGSGSDDGEAEIIISKHRNGSTGIVRLKWFGASCTFADSVVDNQWARE